MLDEVRALLILQDRDRRLISIGKDLEKLPQDEARAKTKLAGDQAAVAKAQEAVKQGEVDVKKIELDAETRRTTIKRLKTQQFETRKNDEFQALGHEIVRYGKELDDLETRELEAMETVDGLRASLKEAETALARTQTLVDEDLSVIRTRSENLKTEQAELTAERDALAARAPESLLPLYHRLMKTKAGLAVVPMREAKCEGCHMKVIASTVMKVATAKEVAQCENCGRILYADD